MRGNQLLQHHHQYPYELMEPIHNRMPIILPRKAEEVWLYGVVKDGQFLKNLLQPYPSELITAYEVSTLVNSPKNDVEECLEPL
jgi:putative SOS response-associated peptidase YedK